MVYAVQMTLVLVHILHEIFLHQYLFLSTKTRKLSSIHHLHHFYHIHIVILNKSNMTKLNDAIYNLSKNYYYEIMDFFYNRDKASFFLKERNILYWGPQALGLGLVPQAQHIQRTTTFLFLFFVFFFFFCGSKEQPHLNQIKMGNVLRPKKLNIVCIVSCLHSQPTSIIIFLHPL